MNQNNNKLELKPVKIKVLELGPEECVRPAEVYYVEYVRTLCCKFPLITTARVETLGIGVNLVIDVEPDGQPYFIEFLIGLQRWEINDNFLTPQDCGKGLVKFILPLGDEWYPDPNVVRDKERKNACIQLSKEPVTRNIQIAENVIFSVDNNMYLHRIWLLNIETRKE